MSENTEYPNYLLSQLQERNKELNCLYNIEDFLNRGSLSIPEAFELIIKVLPSGWRFPGSIKVKISYDNKNFTSEDFIETHLVIFSNIVIQEKTVGQISVYYTEEVELMGNRVFLEEESRLLKTVADRLGHFILHSRLKDVYSEIQHRLSAPDREGKAEWRVILEMLRKTDPKLFYGTLRKLLHQLLWNGVDGAERLLELSSIDQKVGDSEKKVDDNRPLPKRLINNYDEYINAILKLANDNLPDEQILEKIQKWIQEAKANGLVKAVESTDASLEDISDAIRKYFHLAPEKFELSESTTKGLRVSLVRRFFTDQLEYIKIAKEFVKLTDFYDLINKMIFHAKSHGKLGGKSAGLFLANNILRNSSKTNEILKNIKTPRTWFIASDGVMHFLQYNDMEDVLQQKHKDLDQIRIEYPHIVQMFKNAQFPPDIIKGLSVALDDFEERPLIVRSSSIMEDQMGQSFSGKYKSLFLANQGTKKERLAALLDAVSEVYASTFSPDPIEYRAERELIDFHEEMGIMIQEVVGSRIGDYFCPSFAGVAFSNNEFRWSTRIKREDGLIRIVPGLGTRAVDRLSDDFPILLAPGQPNLRVNFTLTEMMKYSPKYIDVINLKTNQFETIELDKMIKECGDKYSGINYVVSVNDNGIMRDPAFDTDYKNDDLIATFEGLFKKTDFIKKIDNILKTLQYKIKSPVDIEFAHDGKDLYLLQCRPQSYQTETISDPIPKDVSEDKIIFNAKRYVSNGKIEDITHIVYVIPEKYNALPDIESMKDIGRAVSKLNKVLPKRQFILMGPGRWGSRGDIKLGVSVTYSDINNTSMLIEIAKKKGNYVPDLSFGTHFFQDLVEASIQYLPLYPDDEGIIFNNRFFELAENQLSELVPEYSHCSDTVKVVNVPKSADGHILKVLLNADLDEAMALLLKPFSSKNMTKGKVVYSDNKSNPDHIKWRDSMAQKIAASLNPEYLKIKEIYLYGNTPDSEITLESKINLIFHLENKDKVTEMNSYLKGWSDSLSELNYQRTGHQTDGLLLVEYYTDEEIEGDNQVIKKINSLTEPAKKLELNKLT